MIEAKASRTKPISRVFWGQVGWFQQEVAHFDGPCMTPRTMEILVGGGKGEMGKSAVLPPFPPSAAYCACFKGRIAVWLVSWLVLTVAQSSVISHFLAVLMCVCVCERGVGVRRTGGLANEQACVGVSVCGC